MGASFSEGVQDFATLQALPTAAKDMNFLGFVDPARDRRGRELPLAGPAKVAGKKIQNFEFFVFFPFFSPENGVFPFFPRKHQKREILGDLSQCLVDGDAFHQKGKSGMGFQPS